MNWNGLLLVLMGSTGLLSSPGVASAEEPKKPTAGVIAIQRGGGFVDPARSPNAHYWFNVTKDGNWEYKPLKGDTRKGKLGADDVFRWLKDIEDGGFDKLKSNPALGAADEPFMEITIQVKDRKEQKRIPLQEKLAQAIEKKVIAVARPGK